MEKFALSWHLIKNYNIFALFQNHQRLCHLWYISNTIYKHGLVSNRESSDRGHKGLRGTKRSHQLSLSVSLSLLSLTFVISLPLSLPLFLPLNSLSHSYFPCVHILWFICSNINVPFSTLPPITYLSILLSLSLFILFTKLSLASPSLSRFLTHSQHTER